MNLFDVILKLIQELHLVSRDKFAQLNVEVNEWESQCTETSKEKDKQLYAKIHKGVWVRLLMPFAYFFLFNWVRTSVMGAGTQDDDEEFFKNYN